MQAAVKKMSDSPEVQGSLLTISEKLQKAFDIDEDTLNAIVSGIGNVFDAVFDATNANTEAAISKNDELLDSIGSASSYSMRTLTKKKERQDAGLANSLEGKAKGARDGGEELKALKEQETKEEAISPTAIAGSSKGRQQYSINGPPLMSLPLLRFIISPAGIPIAIATIAAFIGIISKIKSSSKKLYTGGPLDQEGVTGFVNKQGRSDRNGGVIVLRIATWY